MKKIILYFLLNVIAFYHPLVTCAQETSLHENFDVACVTDPFFAASWIDFNPNIATDPYGAWTCTATDGNHNTPGMECTGYYSGGYHIDTSFLVTPMLNLSSFATRGQSVYFRFDSKTTQIYNGSRLSIVKAPYPDAFVMGSSTNLDLTDIITPGIGNPDSEGWATHEINLTSLEQTGNFYLTFMYTSTATSGSIWYIDNVVTDTVSMAAGVPIVSSQMLPITVIGMPTNNEIKLSYSAPAAGQYHLAIYDMIGRQVYTELLNAHSGNATYSIKGIDLPAGMYCIKMGDGITYGITKAMIP